MSDLTKHTLIVNIADRIEWIDRRCGLSEIQKDYVTAQMKEAVKEAVQQANGLNKQDEKALPIQRVSNQLFCPRCGAKNWDRENGFKHCLECEKYW